MFEELVDDADDPDVLRDAGKAGPEAADAADNEIDPDAASRIIDSVRASGRTLLTEFESKQVLEAYGIPVVGTRLAATADEASRAAAGMGVRST